MRHVGAHLLWLTVACFGPVVIPCSVTAQASRVPQLRLAPPRAELGAEFSQIVSIVELRDGRILIADRIESVVAVADFSSQGVTRIGRPGRGPNEYAGVSALLPLGGDSSLLVDPVMRRWLLLKGARIDQTIPPTAPAHMVTKSFVIGADSNGFLLATGLMSVTVNGAPDSLALLRIAFSSGTVDTVGVVSRDPTRYLTRGVAEDGRPQSIVIVFSPIEVSDRGLIFPDGWIAIVRLQPYRVEWRTPAGRWIRGPALPFRALRMDHRQKQAYGDHLAAWGLKRLPDAPGWPETVPAFLPSRPYPAFIIAPGGRILIARTPTAGQLESGYDLVDRRGQLVARIVLPFAERIAAVGNRGVYVVATDDLGLQRVRLHPWPMN